MHDLWSGEVSGIGPIPFVVMHPETTIQTGHGGVPSLSIGGLRPHLIGIGGCGMSALARMLASRGLDVGGVDSTPSPTTEMLGRAALAVGFDETAGGLGEDRDLVIASAAVKPDHPQVLEAQRRGLSVLSYPEALGKCMAGRTGVALAGTHGKSTTTAMLGCALTDAGLDPSVVVGATCGQLGGGCLGRPALRAETLGGSDLRADTPAQPSGFRLGSPSIPTGTLEGKPGLLLAEACEFNRSFHHLRPVVASIGVVEADHLDIYGSLDEIIAAFAEFAQLIPDAEQGGHLLIAHDGAHRTRITAGLRCTIETIGFSPSADYCIAFEPATRRVCVSHQGRQLGCWVNQMPGEHNAVNAATAFALGVIVGGGPAKLGESLGAFAGLDRRLQLLGSRDHVKVYDDYGHHPTEVAATLEAIRQADDPARHGGRLVVVFQPHQHSRTRFLLDEFATSFSQADVVIVPHIYFVRDSQIEKAQVSSADLVDRLRARKVRAMHLYPFEAIVEQLEGMCRPGDVLIVMGAGPVWQVGRQFLEAGGGA